MRREYGRADRGRRFLAATPLRSRRVTRSSSSRSSRHSIVGGVIAEPGRRLAARPVATRREAGGSSPRSGFRPASSGEHGEAR